MVAVDGFAIVADGVRPNANFAFVHRAAIEAGVGVVPALDVDEVLGAGKERAVADMGLASRLVTNFRA